MATVSSNFVPTFPIPQDGNDSFNRYDLITALAYLNSHQHDANNGAPVKRLYYGAASGTAGGIAAGHAGSVFIETSTPFKFWYDDGTIWRELVDSSIVQTLSNKTLTAPTLTNPIVTGIATFDNNSGVIKFKDSGAVARTVLQAPSDDSVWLVPIKSGGHIYVKNFAANANNVDVDDSGNVTALGYVKANGYRALLQNNTSDYLIQTGTATSAAGAQTVTFATAFAGTPNVTANVVDNSASTRSVKILTVNTTTFTFGAFNAADGYVTSLPISWIAMGQR